MQKTKMHLCIDIGNTRFKAALFEGDNLVEIFKFYKEDLIKFMSDIFGNYNIYRMIVSTTRKRIPGLIRKYGKETKDYIELGPETPLPIKIMYKTPETLGKDRIAAAVGANSLYPDEGNVVLDAGTCITYDYIDASSTYLGGNIAPGIKMRLKAMHKFTANLPLAELIIPENILGTSTKEALQNGAIKGTFYEIDTFIREVEKKYGNTRVILTGGDAIYFVDYFKSKIFVVQNLVLIGLNQILKHNA